MNYPSMVMCCLSTYQMNKAYLQSNKTAAGDECYTPFYAVDPIIKYVPKDYVIWCPFDKEWSAYVQTFTELGYTVIHSHIDDGQDFFTYEPEHYDIIISNPPFSLKDKVLGRLYKLGKPFMLLLPASTIQGQKRFEYFIQGVQLLVLDKRIGFHTKDMEKTAEAPHFGSMYFCKDILPNDLVFERINKYNKVIQCNSLLD